MKRPRDHLARDLDRLRPSSSRRTSGDPRAEGARSTHGTNVAPSSINGRSPLVGPAPVVSRTRRVYPARPAGVGTRPPLWAWPGRPESGAGHLSGVACSTPGEAVQAGFGGQCQPALGGGVQVRLLSATKRRFRPATGAIRPEVLGVHPEPRSRRDRFLDSNAEARQELPPNARFVAPRGQVSSPPGQFRRVISSGDESTGTNGCRPPGRARLPPI